jgi:hypothetical protein
MSDVSKHKILNLVVTAVLCTKTFRCVYESKTVTDPFHKIKKLGLADEPPFPMLIIDEIIGLVQWKHSEPVYLKYPIHTNKNSKFMLYLSRCY